MEHHLAVFVCQPVTPQVTFLFASASCALECWRRAVEDDVIPMLPECPAAEKDEAVEVEGRYLDGSWDFPEGPCEVTGEDDVASRFQFTTDAAVGVVDGDLLSEVSSALYAVLGEEPSKEANSWRRAVLPDMFEGVAGGAVAERISL
jgi:hypothetical protein